MTPRKASPARSQGSLHARKRKSQRTLSSTSVKSNDSVKLTALLQHHKEMDWLDRSPLVGRRSVLTDKTDIEEPKGKSWWRKLSDNNRDVFHVLEDNQIAEPYNILEDLDIEILSQEKKDYTMDLPESSDSESIKSIVLPQRKLFTERVKQPHKMFGKIIGTRDTLAKLDKTNATGIDKTIIATTRELFQNTQHPIVPTATLLNVSPNKTAANTTKELAVIEPTAQVRNIFGDRPTKKRKNIFTNFIASDSEEDIPEKQGKVFEFKKKSENKPRGKTVDLNESHSSRIRTQGKNKSPNSSRIIADEQNVNRQVAGNNKTKIITSAVNPKDKTIKESENLFTADEEYDDEEINFTLRYDDENNEVEPEDKTITEESNVSMKVSTNVSHKNNINMPNSNIPAKSNKVTNEPADLVTQDNDLDRQRSKPIFPAALLNISNKTEADKSKELTTIEQTAQVRNIFGNRPATKRKNIFSDFIASESEDEVPEVQGKIFGFPKKSEVKRRGSSSSRGIREPSPLSSLIHDIEMDDWKMLPSSTMVENQLENMMAESQTPKRARLSKLTEDKESEKGTSNTTKHSNKSNTTKDTSKPRKSKTFTKEKSLELEKTRKSKTFTKEKSPVADSRKSKTFTKEKDDFEFSKNNTNLTEDHDEEMIDGAPVVQDKSNRKTMDQNVSQLSMTRSQAKNYKEKISENQTIYKPNNSKRASQSVLQKDSGTTNSSLSTKSNKVINKTQENDDSMTPKNTSLETSKANDNKIQTHKELHEDIGMDEPDDAANNFALDSEVVKAINAENIDGIAAKNIVPIEAHNKGLENSQYEKVVEQNAVQIEEPNKSSVIQEHEDIENESKNIRELDEIQIANEGEENENDLSHNMGDNIQNESHEIENEDEQNESQGMEDEDEKNESQEIEDENEQNESQEMEDEDEQIESQKVENDDELNKSQEIENEDEQNESQGVEGQYEQNESQEIEDENEQNESQEMEDEDEPIENQEVENQDEQSESQEIENEDEPNENAIQDSEEEDEDQIASQEEIEQQSDTDQDYEEIEQEEDSEAVDSDHDIEPNHAEDNDSDNHVENNDSDNHAEDNDSDNHAEDNDSDNYAEDEPDEQIDGTLNVSHDTTGRHRKKNHSPEAIRHDSQNNMDSFTVRGRNTTARKTDLIKSLHIRPSVAVRESIGSDGSKNSSAEGSGWDSHRTTRKTLRQTFGKDFTPRKSLRALVMEQSARRQTAYNDAASVTHKFPQANSTELPGVSNFFDDELNENQAPSHDVSLRTRQATLGKHLENIAANEAQMRLKIKEAVLKSLNAPPTEHVFKMPAKPMFPRKTQPKKPAKTPFLGDLPPEVIEDLKYKPPKRFKPSNASWITKRLYKYLETKLEPKYDYKARVRAERLVEHLYEFAKHTRRRDVAAPDAVAALKREMARLGIVTTHFEFDHFFQEFMPREIRVRVVPDIVNNISVPRNYIYASIL